MTPTKSDASFTRKERLGTIRRPKGHGRIAPDLAVEVVSPNDRAKDLVSKLQDFRNAGIPLTWVLYPETQTVQVHRLDGSMTTLNCGDFLEGENILPGFRVEVSELFA
jgi:Uma2 family endonuclease